MVLVAEKLDSSVDDRRMSRVLRKFSTEIQELATKQVQKDSLKLMRNSNTRTEIAAKIREISALDIDQVNNLPQPQLLAAINAKYPIQRGAEKVKWFMVSSLKKSRVPTIKVNHPFERNIFFYEL
jgi:hypothetical protein